MAGKGDAVVGSRRSNKGRAFVATAATSLAAAGMILFSATAFADDAAAADSDAPKCLTPNSDGTCPLPGTTIIRSADRGVAQAGVSTVTGAPKGTAWGDGDDASKGAPILIHDGNQSPLCFANNEFDNTACGLG
jgi:hypothetical protein